MEKVSGLISLKFTVTCTESQAWCPGINLDKLEGGDFIRLFHYMDKAKSSYSGRVTFELFIKDIEIDFEGDDKKFTNYKVSHPLIINKYPLHFDFNLNGIYLTLLEIKWSQEVA